MSSKSYLYEMLRLSGLSEAYLEPEQQRVWDTKFSKFRSDIQGVVSHIIQAIEGIVGYTPDWELPKVTGDEFYLSMFKSIHKFANDIQTYYARNKYINPGSKWDYIFKSLKSLKEILFNIHNIVLKKEQFIESKHLGEELENYYRQHIEPLVTYISQLLDKSFSAERVI